MVVCVLMASHAIAQCVQVALYDDASNIIVPGGLVTGMKIGETVVFNVGLPPHREQKEARPIPCPQDLETAIRDLYNRSCTSDQARQQTAVNRQTSLDVVVQGCAEMRSALSSED